jgi:hypothetical protein
MNDRVSNGQRTWLNLLNLHIVGVVILLGVVLFLGVKALVAFHEAGAAQSESFAQQQILYTELQANLAHLQGLPEKVDQSRDDAAHFYEERLAPNYSSMAAELGDVEVKNQVRLTRAQYLPSPAIDGVQEVRIDANLSGDYAPLMHFINDLERDKNHVFFIIKGITLTGQQGGLVNLRLRMSTYLKEGANDLPATSGGDAGADASPSFVSSAEVR